MDHAYTMECDSDFEVQKKPITRKVSEDDLKHLILSRVKLRTDCVLGQGSYGTVYKAEHKGIVCAAKQLDIGINSGLVERVKDEVKQNFLMECLQHSKLRHRNIITMLGVFYPKRADLPVLVMELMEYNLTQLLERSHNIIMYVKLSILQDVSRGLCYLHDQNPPIVHQALYSDNILITRDLTAKITNFKTGAEYIISDQALPNVRQRNRTFLPFSGYFLTYDLPLNVFSFGCIICHAITQEWPWESPDSCACNVDHFVYYYEKRGPNSLGKRQDYIDLISDNSIKQLVEVCLQSKPKNRPHMLQIHDRITSIMAGEFIHLLSIIM